MVGILDKSATIGFSDCEGAIAPKRWADGAVAFFPAGTRMVVPKGERFSETLITLDEQLFVSAARGYIDHSRIEFRFQDLSAEVAAHIAMAIKQLAVGKTCEDWPLIAESAAVALTAAVVKSMSPEANIVISNLKNGLSHERKMRAVDYIREHIDRPITIAALARESNMSQFHFVRSFRKSLGVSPLRYVTALRVEEAKRLLRGTSDSLAGVAHATGFCSQSHMTTVFKRIVGVAPGEYRRGVVTACCRKLTKPAEHGGYA